MKRLTLLLVAAALLAPAAAEAGCMATVGLSSLPKGIHAGETWVVNITVKQHGVRLLAGAKPTVTITSMKGRQQLFRAVPTNRTGVYRAKVTFPSAGRWNYVVNDGFVPQCDRDHSFAAVTVLPAINA